MEEKENFKQPGSSENHAFHGGKPIICKLSLHPDLTISEKEIRWQNNIFCATDHVNKILSSACLNQLPSAIIIVG